LRNPKAMNYENDVRLTVQKVSHNMGVALKDVKVRGPLVVKDSK
jgi:hypothetical protein